MYFFYFYLLSLFAVSFIVIFTHCSLTFSEKKKSSSGVVPSVLFQSQGLGVGGPSSGQKEVLWDTQERITLLSNPEALRHWALLPPAFLASAL